MHEKWQISKDRNVRVYKNKYNEEFEFVSIGNEAGMQTIQK